MKAVVTITGKDSVGIIGGVCTHLASYNVNIMDISQTVLQGGYFSMSMVADVSQTTAEFQELAKEMREYGAQRGDGRENADYRRQNRVRQPAVPVRLHGQEHVQEHHDQEQEAHLLQTGRDYAVFRPAAHVHHVYDGLRLIRRIDHKVYQRAEQRDAKGQKTVADERGEEVVPLARPQVHQPGEVVEHEEEGGKHGQQPGVVPVAKHRLAGGGGADHHQSRDDVAYLVAREQALYYREYRRHILAPPL